MRVVILFLLLTACGERVVYVYADAGPQPDVQSVGDAATPEPDAWSNVDAWALPGDCEPYRSPGTISQTDCARYPSAPVCDAIASHCSPGPTTYCDACATDEQCRNGVDLRAECVFLPMGAGPAGDSACMSPCASDADCSFLSSFWMGAHPISCLPTARGSYCMIPFADGTATCSNFMGGRRGD